MSIHQYFCPAWDLLWIFLTGFVFISAPVKKTQSSPPILRAPGSEKKVLRHLFLAIACFLCLFLSPLFGCLESCCGKYFSYEPIVTFRDWVKLISLCTLSISGFLAGGLWDWIKWRKARRLLYRFITDGIADGSLRAVYELDDDREWSIHNIREKNDRELWRLAGRIADAKEYNPVYIAFNLDEEEVLQRIKQYHLITKNGYEVRSYAELAYRIRFYYYWRGDKWLEKVLPGSSVLLFYYEAEYVRIWSYEAKYVRTWRFDKRSSAGK